MDNNLTDNSNERHMLTTLDNPYNPFSQFDEWYRFDILNGYNTCAYLARIAKTSNELSENDEALAIEEAIDEIIKINVTGNYIKITQSQFDLRFKHQ